MSQSRPHSQEAAQPSLVPSHGWHCSHYFYRFDRPALATLNPAAIRSGGEQLIRTLDPMGEVATARLQTSIVAGHKADFGLMLMDPEPLKIDAVHQQLMASQLGPVLCPTYSFVSMTEISEYVPTPDQYAERLVQEGEQEGSPAYKAKLQAYETRLPKMNQQRLTPDFPPWPATCFYPMNKRRKTGENWFLLPFSVRSRMMAEHALSGMEFAGKVTQLITVGIGLEDWEWGVTLWASNPQFLKEIVYRMRFDEASARYAQFGPFYTSYVASIEEVLRHCRILQ